VKVELGVWIGQAVDFPANQQRLSGVLTGARLAYPHPTNPCYTLGVPYGSPLRGTEGQLGVLFPSREGTY
jgi:hypothetical protein